MFASNTSQVSSDATYIEDVFSTWLYTGNGSTQTITNGIDEAGKGALTWIKQRSTAGGHQLYDTARGATQLLSSSNANAQSTFAAGLTSFNADGFSLGNGINCNTSGETYASWTFRKQPKFFDVVTWTGNGATSRTISHNLGSAPGVLILKNVSNSSSWSVFHRSLGVSQTLLLNDTTGAFGASGRFGSSAPTATTFDINDIYNTNGDTYVAYLFAHNAGGFGLTGTDNVISCGSFTTDGSGNATVSLGYEPQWVMYKRSDGTGSWAMFDNMRGMTVNTTNGDKILFANLSDAESSVDWIQPTATGFNPYNIAWNATYIYIAIRRGPMKTPTSGTSVLSSNTSSGGTGTVITTGFPVDMQIARTRDSASQYGVVDRLRGTTSTTSGSSLVLNTAATDAEFSSTSNARAWDNTGFQMPSNWSGTNTIFWNFRRAPGFFDEVCYTGTGAIQNLTHNLGVAPEMMIVKDRGPNSGSWRVYHSALGPTKLLTLNLANAAATLSTIWNNTAPTSSVFTIGTYGEVNLSGDTFVNYLFASCPGVSKVGSYTGNGSTQTINCGFTGGARFVLIKRTDSTGDWYVYDTARGIVSANDPRLSLNTAAAEVTTDDSIDPDNSGFIVNQVSATNINVSSATYIYLAIA